MLPSDVLLGGLDCSNGGVGVDPLFGCPSLSEIKQRRPPLSIFLTPRQYLRQYF